MRKTTAVIVIFAIETKMNTIALRRNIGPFVSLLVLIVLLAQSINAAPSKFNKPKRIVHLAE
jgi:hypothetical protein